MYKKIPNQPMSSPNHLKNGSLHGSNTPSSTKPKIDKDENDKTKRKFAFFFFL